MTNMKLGHLPVSLWKQDCYISVCWCDCDGATCLHPTGDVSSVRTDWPTDRRPLSHAAGPLWLKITPATRSRLNHGQGHRLRSLWWSNNLSGRSKDKKENSGLTVTQLQIEVLFVFCQKVSSLLFELFSVTPTDVNRNQSTTPDIRGIKVAEDASVLSCSPVHMLPDGVAWYNNGKKPGHFFCAV